MAEIHINMRQEFGEYVCKTPSYSTAYDTIRRMHSRFKVVKNPGAAAIYGDAGTGKSRLIETYKRDHPIRYVDTPAGRKLVIPVLHFQVPENCSIRKFVSEICYVMGIDAPKSNNTSELKEKVIRLILHAEIELIAVDEAQAFLDINSRSNSDEVAKFVRYIIDKTRVPFVFLGTPEYQQFVDRDEPIRRRFKMACHVDLFPAPVESHSTLHYTTQAFLKILKDTCNRSLESGFTSLELAQRIYLMSGGRIGPIFDFFDQYIEDEMWSNSTKTTFGIKECRRVFETFDAPFALYTDKPAFDLPKSSLKKLLSSKYPTPNY